MQLEIWEEQQYHAAVISIMANAQGAKLTIPQLAQRAGLSPSTVYRIWSFETMFPQWRTINRLAEAVGLRHVLVPMRKRKVA